MSAKKDEHPTITKIVRESLLDINSVIDNSKTIKRFNKLVDNVDKINLRTLDRGRSTTRKF